MAPPRDRIAVGMPNKSSDGRFYGPFPRGDKFAILAGGAAGLASADGVLVDANGVVLAGDAGIVVAGGGTLVNAAGQALASNAAAIVAAGGSLSDEGGTIYLQENFAPYTTISQAISAGKFDSANTSGPATHAIASLTGPDGSTTVKAYASTYNPGSGEPDTNLQWTLPGYINGNYATGVEKLNIRWRERRLNWLFTAEKSVRAFGRESSGNVNLDLLLCFNGSGGVCNRLVTVGQGMAEDSQFIDAATTWPSGGAAWRTIEWEIKLNTVGNTDGWQKVWMHDASGTQIFFAQATGLNMRDNVSRGDHNNQFRLSGFRLGGWESGFSENGPPTSETRYMTDVVIADHYIGP